MTSVIYAANDTLETPVAADRWMAQTGNGWMAVPPFETAEEWFENQHLDFAPQLVRPINDIPTDGTLVWLDPTEGILVMPAAEAAARLRDAAAPIETMARAMADAEDSDCFAAYDIMHGRTPSNGESENLAEPLVECDKWLRLAGVAWNASRPIPAAAVHG